MVKATHLKATRAMFAAPAYDVLRITPIAPSFYSFYSSVVMKKARANPKVVTRPTCLPPYLKASGIMVSANIVKSGLFPVIPASVQKAPSLFVNPSSTSTLPRVVSATIFAAVEAGIFISTPLRPASIFASASLSSVPLKSSS
jgi:hypothetical protein